MRAVEMEVIKPMIKDRWSTGIEPDFKECRGRKRSLLMNFESISKDLKAEYISFSKDSGPQIIHSAPGNLWWYFSKSFSVIL
jgi:hypothetical protein